MITLSNKSKQFLWLVLKVGILILLGIFIYNTLVNQNELSWESFSANLLSTSLFSFQSILILIFLTIINWFFEITKWKLLGSQVESLSFIEASEQSLASLSFSLLTPNRIGEYGAKALYFKKEERKKVMILNFIGNFHQLLVTLMLGFIGLIIIEPFLRTNATEFPINFVFILVILLAVSILILMFNKRFISWRQKKWDNLDFISRKLNSKVFLFSLIRYLIFSHQFYFLIQIFEVDMAYPSAMAGIASMYLISSIVPALSLFDFVLKGSVAVLIFGLFDISPSLILCITTLMWILNFAGPAIIGSYFVLRFKPIHLK